MDWLIGNSRMCCLIPPLSALLVACQSGTAPAPAVLEAGDAESLVRLKSAVARAVGKDRVDFGPGDLTVSPEIAVLPPPAGPYEGQSLAIPTLFDLAEKDGACVIVRREDGEVFAAEKVRCHRLAKNSR